MSITLSIFLTDSISLTTQLGQPVQVLTALYTLARIALEKNYSSCANSSHVYYNNETSIFSHENCEDKASQQNEDDFLSTYLVAYIEKEIA
ncbi:hypothetical protein J1N35_030366 [Gossypium stocksii]|uniref:Uncharacterized protein n=1 Tax=Gossypium stocksii TaxID=47602 RepID=A0A9D3ZUN6_9ROSI|nr:hypothetical protein J1N35_030366 [Gossypium stocksii]